MNQRLSIKNKIKIVLLSFLSISLIGVSLGLFLNDMLKNKALKETSTEIATSVNDAYNQGSTPDETLPEEKPIPEYTTGKYAVGTDIPSGTYKLIASSETPGFYKISRSSSDNYLDMSENDVFPTFTYVFIDEGQFLMLVDATAIPMDQAPPYIPQKGKYLSGKYLVGKDIPEGNYTVYPERDFGYIEVAPAAVRDVSSLLLSKYIEGPFNINLSEGEFLKLSSAYIELQ